MNRPLRNTLLAAAATCLFANCTTTSTPAGRIERNPSMYSSLPSSHKRAIQSGQLVEGMNKNAVYLAWGRPSGIKEGSAYGKKLEKWRYVGHRPIYVNHIGIGSGYGRRGRYCNSGYYDYGHTVDYVPYTAAVVEFHNGKVSGWERER